MIIIYTKWHVAVMCIRRDMQNVIYIPTYKWRNTNVIITPTSSQRCFDVTVALFLHDVYAGDGTLLFKSNRNLFSSAKWWHLFSMYRFEIFHVAWWGILHSLWKISWVYVIASRLCEHSNVVRFEKLAAKTLQQVYGDIGMLYDIITTYERFFCYTWHELCSNNKLLDFSSIYYFLVKYAI